MSSLDQAFLDRPATSPIVNLSRRGVLAGVGAGALVLGIGVPMRGPRAQAGGDPPASAKARNVGAFLAINADNTITLLNPFIEGGQGVNTSIPQIIAEELDAEVTAFRVESAPAGAAYQLMFGDQMRLTGGSLSIRTTFASWRTLGASARAMLIRAAEARWGVATGQLTTEPMHVVHAASGRRATYGELAAEAAALTPPEQVTLKDPARFRLIGQPVKRLDTHAKSTGAAQYGIDLRLPEMLTAAVVHAPVVGGEPTEIANEAALRAMPGVHSIHRLPGAVAAVGQGFWAARQAVAAAQVTWSAGTAPAFTSAAGLAALKARNDEAGAPAESHGDAPAALRTAARRLEAEYDVPFLAHATMEPQNATARFNADGTLDVWVPNQGPDFYRQYAARDAGLPPERVNIHSPLLGGFFGRRFVYGQEPMTQAILLARATGRPVQVIWTREEDFKRDHHRPQSHVKLRGGLDAQGNITGLHITAVGEGPLGRHFSAMQSNPNVDPSVTEGLTERAYAIPNRRVDYVRQTTPANIGFWRSVGHSMNDFFYESFLDELLRAGGKDLYQGRLDLLAHSPRHATLLRTVAELAGGWRPGVYERDGTRRAMGIALASPFGSEVATMAEVSLDGDEARVHNIWVAIDPGRVVNPAIVAAQVRSAVAIGLSQTLVEAMTFAEGRTEQTNFDSYAILPPARMPLVWTAIVESGAPMGGVGEPGTPGVPGAVCNALATLTGQRVRSLPVAGTRLGRV